MAISLIQHSENITRRIIASFEDDAPIRSGFSAFFPSVTTIEKSVGIEVERNRQLVAVDVQRNTDPNRNIFSISAEKLFIPPFYNESWDFTSAQRYDVTFGNQTNPSSSDALNMINQAAKRMKTLRNKIERAIEIQRAQALQTGVVQLKNGDNIDYKRKAASLVVRSGADRWNQTNSLPLTDIATGCNFLREEGLSSGMAVNAVMGRDAFTAFMNNPQVKSEADFRRISRLEIGMPQFSGVTGMVFHGQVATADYAVNIWTYNEFYENANGSKSTYLDVDKVLLIPEDFKGATAFAGIPAIMRDKNNAEFPQFISPVEAEFYINNYVDPVKKAHWFEIASAPLAIPVSIDRVYTLSVLTA
jgi:hypothetical protein